MEERILRVSGMSCSGCEQRFVTVLSRIEGVVRSSADHTTGEVRVVLDPGRNSEEAISDAIERAGYAVVRHG